MEALGPVPSAPAAFQPGTGYAGQYVPAPGDDLADALAGFRNDPFGFVLWAFPWGEAGTELARWQGPEPWQEELLRRIGNGSMDLNTAVQVAVASGHGIGKSAFVSWVILWALTTLVDTRGVVTANTENQLKTKTWKELAKWHRLFIGRELFKYTATSLFSVDRAHSDWRIDMVPWSENNTEAFAGLHNQGKRVILLMDEASAIPDVIWETSSGMLTDADTEVLWIVCGNPTKNSGRFFDCFHPPIGADGMAVRTWLTRQIDSRTVSHTNKKLFAKWAAEWGEDSDFMRIRVRGVFPRVGESEFIGRALVDDAMSRALSADEAWVSDDEPLILGVDVARFGPDSSVIFARRGRDARTIPYRRFQGISTTQLAAETIRMMRDTGARLVAVDGGGVGGGVIDILRNIHRIDVVEVQFGEKANPSGGREVARYANKRAELWGSMRDWLRGGALPRDPQMLAELTAPRYIITGQETIQLERKDAMKARGADSPDIADALAITFAVDTSFMADLASGPVIDMVAGVDYNPFGGMKTYV